MKLRGLQTAITASLPSRRPKKLWLSARTLTVIPNPHHKSSDDPTTKILVPRPASHRYKGVMRRGDVHFRI